MSDSDLRLVNVLLKQIAGKHAQSEPWDQRAVMDDLSDHGIDPDEVTFCYSRNGLRLIVTPPATHSDPGLHYHDEAKEIGGTQFHYYLEPEPDSPDELALRWRRDEIIRGRK